MKYFVFIALVIFFISCSDKRTTSNNNPVNTSPDYVQGEVAIGLKDSVSLEEFADYIYSFYSISIYQAVSFQYYSDLPKDSMNTLKTALDAEPYAWAGMTNVSYADSNSKILVSFWIQNFRAEDRDKWKALRERYHLTHVPYNFQSGLLIVGTGQEKAWISYLKNSNLFNFVGLNSFAYLTWRDSTNIVIVRPE